jgi:hypothetical protein
MASCMEDCKHFGFTSGKSQGGYGCNWWCKKKKERIEDASVVCALWEDRYKLIVPEAEEN